MNGPSPSPPLGCFFGTETPRGEGGGTQTRVLGGAALPVSFGVVCHPCSAVVWRSRPDRCDEGIFWMSRVSRGGKMLALGPRPHPAPRCLGPGRPARVRPGCASQPALSAVGHPAACRRGRPRALPGCCQALVLAGRHLLYPPGAGSGGQAVTKRVLCCDVTTAHHALYAGVAG